MLALSEAPPPSGPGGSPWMASRVLEIIETLPAGATGALVFGKDPPGEGTVLVEGGRVCWASSRKQPRRLTDLLRDRVNGPPLDRSVLEHLYRRCRETGAPLGETLVAQGLVSESGLRGALLEHSSDALAAIVGSGSEDWCWVPHRRSAYDAKFTFAPAEILVALGGRRRQSAAVRAAEMLASSLAFGGRGAAFARSETASQPVPLAQHDCAELTAHELLEIGRRTASTLDLCEALDSGTTLVIAADNLGNVVLCWRADGFEFCALCDDPSVASCVMATLARTRSNR